MAVTVTCSVHSSFRNNLSSRSWDARDLRHAVCLQSFSVSTLSATSCLTIVHKTDLTLLPASAPVEG